MSSRTMLVGIGIGIGVLALGGGAAFALVNYMNSKKTQYNVQDVPQTQVTVMNDAPDRIIGRPFARPFYNHYGRSEVWGSSPWMYRHPMMTPVTPHWRESNHRH